MQTRFSRPYDNQLVTWILITVALVVSIVGVISAVSIPQADPCLPATQQEVGSALTMPLTYVELGGASFGVLLYWLFIQNEVFLGQNWLRWIVALLAGGTLGMLGVWSLSFFAAECSRQAISSAADFGIGPIFGFGNALSQQFYNARAIEVTGWTTLTTGALWGGRLLWLKARR